MREATMPAVHRGDRRLAVTTPSNLEIAMTRAFQAPRERVFDAFGVTVDEVLAWLEEEGTPES